MNIIDRYISAYVVQCLFPSEPGPDFQYVCEVLLETQAKSSNPVLQEVLETVKMYDPSSESVQTLVRQRLLELLENKGGPLGLYTIANGVVILTVQENGRTIGIGATNADNVADLIEMAKKRYPNITIRQVSE